MFADFAGAGGAAVDVPVVALLVHVPVLHAPHLAVTASVNKVDVATAAGEVSRTVTSIDANPATNTAAAVGEFCQDEAHFFIFF